ncbi:MAG: hypothetical protein K2J47_03425, partial [Ruminococcus sp.]|nr:hypothetical protein [Ruminococcus sp.]
MTYDELKTEFESRVKSLKMTDMTALNRKSAEILGELVSENVFEIDDISESCKKILREYYERMNETNVRIQKELDEKNGLQIAPQKADFPSERVAQIAESLTDKTVPPETIQRRARSAVENVANSFHDDYIRENAKFRSKAGIKCYIVRETDGNCCKWCTSLAGRYVYGEEPDDIFRRHDNCTCTVTFENGRERQDVWSKNKWQTSEIPKVPYEPLVLDKNQAENLQNIQLEKYKGLDKSVKSGIINSRGSGKTVFIDSDGHICELIDKIDFNDKEAVAHSLKEFEEKYKNSDIEHCRVITVSGEVYEVHGELDLVNTEMLGDLMKGSINEHNHVTSETQYSFSEEDVIVSNRDGTKIALAFDEKYRYSMVFPDKSIPEDVLYNAYIDSFN